MHLSKKFEKRFNNLLTKEEIAIELGVSPRTIANWMSSGKIPSVRIGRRNFGLKRDIEIWIERNRRKK
ncbi:MAG: helix-turn-helix domain-containing protein [Pseudobacteriovorax sp.]|nr:helix-turn-helix domain-containing protein [Pseudobacteriovorax sp.]